MTPTATLPVSALKTGVASRFATTVIDGFVNTRGLRKLYEANGGIPPGLDEDTTSYMCSTISYRGELYRVAVAHPVDKTALIHNVGCVSDVAVSKTLVETLKVEKPRTVLILGKETRCPDGSGRELTLEWAKHTYPTKELLALLLETPQPVGKSNRINTYVFVPGVYGPSSKVSVIDGRAELVAAEFRKQFFLTDVAESEWTATRVVAMTSRNCSMVFSLPNATPIPSMFQTVNPDTVVFHSPEPMFRQDLIEMFKLIGEATDQTCFWHDLDTDKGGTCTHRELVAVLLNKIKPNICDAEVFCQITGTTPPTLAPVVTTPKPKPVRASTPSNTQKRQKYKKEKPKPEPLKAVFIPASEVKAAAEAQSAEKIEPARCNLEESTPDVLTKAEADNLVAALIDTEPEQNPAQEAQSTVQNEAQDALLRWALNGDEQMSEDQETVVLSRTQADVYHALARGNKKRIRAAARAARKARAAAIKASFLNMLDTLALSGWGKLPEIAGLTLEETRDVFILLGTEAGVSLTGKGQWIWVE